MTSCLATQRLLLPKVRHDLVRQLLHERFDFRVNGGGVGHRVAGRDGRGAAARTAHLHPRVHVAEAARLEVVAVV